MGRIGRIPWTGFIVAITVATVAPGLSEVLSHCQKLRILFGFLAVLSQLYPLEANVSTILGGVAPIILGIVLQKPGRSF